MLHIWRRWWRGESVNLEMDVYYGRKTYLKTPLTKRKEIPLRWEHDLVIIRLWLWRWIASLELKRRFILLFSVFSSFLETRIALPCLTTPVFVNKYFSLGLNCLIMQLNEIIIYEGNFKGFISSNRVDPAFLYASQYVL